MGSTIIAKHHYKLTSANTKAAGTYGKLTMYRTKVI